MSPDNRLSELRKAAGWTQTELAAKLGTSRGKHAPLHLETISRWERWGRIPDHRKFELANLFGVSVPYLMGWSDYEGTP